MIPAYQEVGLIARTLRSVPSWVHQIIVVDDGSDDGTSSAALAVGDPRLILITLPQNRGVGAAIAVGYRTARSHGADIVTVMAGDAQMDPEDLMSIIIPILNHKADYVKGNRLLHSRASDMPFQRRIGTQLLGYGTAWATGLHGIGDSQCGYTAISGELIDKIPLERLYPRYGYPNDLLSWVAIVNGRVVEVPVRPVYAGERSGLRPRHLATIATLLARAAARRWVTAMR